VGHCFATYRKQSVRPPWLYITWCITPYCYLSAPIDCYVFCALYRFVCKNNGVLFENDLVQIGVKSEFRQNLGRLNLFYGNKTVNQFHAFIPEVHCNGPLAHHILCYFASKIMSVDCSFHHSVYVFSEVIYVAHFKLLTSGSFVVQKS